MRGGAGRIRSPRGELWVGTPEGASGSLTLSEPPAARATVELKAGIRAYRFAVPRGTSTVRVDGPVAYLWGR